MVRCRIYREWDGWKVAVYDTRTVVSVGLIGTVEGLACWADALRFACAWLRVEA